MRLYDTKCALVTVGSNAPTSRKLSSGKLQVALTEICSTGVDESVTVRSFTFSNTHTGQVVINITFSGDNEDDDYNIVSNMTLDSGDTLVLLEAGEEIGLARQQRLMGSCDIVDVVEYASFGGRSV